MFAIIIPAYNEEKRIANSLNKLALFGKKNPGTIEEIIVVDDGSQDATAHIVSIFAKDDPKIHLIKLAENHGKGYAVRTGMLSTKANLAIFCDADLATPIEEGPRIISEHPNAHVIIGTRYTHGKGLIAHPSLIRKIASKMWNFIRRKTLLPNASDSQCGFKIFSRRAIDSIFPLQTISGFGFDVELLVIAEQQGLKVEEASVEWQNSTPGEFRLIKASLTMLRDLIRIRRNLMFGVYGTRPKQPKK